MARADEEGAPGQEGDDRPAWWRRAVGSVVVWFATALLAFPFSPRPGVWVIRRLFERDAAAVKAALAAHAPSGVRTISDQQYRVGDDDARLDVYFPNAADQPGTRLPTLIWTHGGGWVSGYKDDAAPYFQLIAAEGFTVISLGYSLAPGKRYPTPVRQVNDALVYVQQNADRFHVDVDRIVLAGDSAGAQITSQVAALVTNPTYAGELGLSPSLRPGQLRGVVLYCGFYDMRVFLERAELAPIRVLRRGIKTIVWAYTGSRERDSATLRQMSAIDQATSDFPPTFISGGNGDPLTDAHSRPFAATLDGLGVSVTMLFYPADHEPSLGHEYQFKPDNADGRQALAQTLAFLRRQTG